VQMPLQTSLEMHKEACTFLSNFFSYFFCVLNKIGV
jgi:hypothetical protein